jgi:hypothetical protein
MVYCSISGSEGASSSVSSSSVELQAEKALLIGGRTGGMSIVVGASVGRRVDVFGDSDGVRIGNENSGHDRGDKGAMGSYSDWYVGIDLSCALMNCARWAE